VTGLKGLRPAAVAKLRRFTYLVPPSLSRRVKGHAEIFYWKAELERYVSWYNGETLHGTPPPAPEERVTGHTPAIDAAMTFVKLAQYRRYQDALDLVPRALVGKRVLDVGCGPLPNLLVFEDCERHGVDPLVNRYRAAGYPLDTWSAEGFTYHCAPAEKMPFSDDYFDAVVSVNAVDHVDDFNAVAQEIQRVLRPDGLLRMQVNYHRPTVTEPVSLNDAAMQASYRWVPGLRKLRDEPHPSEAGERLTLWGGGERSTAEQATVPPKAARTDG
jgi:ubiquinone/menaquinone biosynthesis C-methylase UbiE